MQVICSDAGKCGNKKCPGAKPHGESLDSKTGKTCRDIMSRCSCAPSTLVSCIPYKPYFGLKKAKEE